MAKITESDIVGYWRDENFGGQSAEDLIFFPGGEGVMDFYNPGPAGRVPFRWSLLDEGTRLRFEPALWRTDTVDISCFEKHGRRGLRIEFDGNANLGVPRVGSDYYLSDRPLSEYKPPQQ